MRTAVTPSSSAHRAPRWLLAGVALAALLPAPLAAQNATAPAGANAATATAPAKPLSAAQQAILSESYGRPPEAIARLVDAPRHRNVTLGNPSPDRTRFLVLRSGGLPEAAAFAKPNHNLAGLQIDRRASRSRTMTTRGSTGLEIHEARGGRMRSVQVPSGATVSDAVWSPDGTQVGFYAHFDDATHIYVADAATGRSRRLTRTPVLATLVTDFAWSADGRTIATVLVPDGRGAEPVEPAVAPGPDVRVNQDYTAKNRTFADLLQTPHEKKVLEHFITGQLALVDVRSGTARKVGAPAMFRAVDMAPDASHLRVTLVQQPFSYIVPVSSFGSVEQLWRADGRMVAELARRPLRDGSPADGDGDDPDAGAADTARRNLAWSPDGQGFVYLQLAPRPAGRDSAAAADAAPAGRGGAAARRRDRVVRWLPPYDSAKTTVLFESDNRMSSVAFSEDAQTLFVTESQSGVSHTYAVYLSDPSKKYTIARSRGGAGRFGDGGGGGGAAPSTPAARAAEDSAFYANPGALRFKRGRFGTQVVQLSTDGRHVFLEGTQYDRDPLARAPRPFVDRVEIRTGTKSRVFQSAADVYEDVTLPLDDDYTAVLLVRESPTMVPDSWVRDLASGTLTRLTNNTDVTPEITAAQRKLVQVERVDGVKFWTTVTLPADWKPGTRLPAMFWFYPREYTDQESYDRTRRTHNRNRFPATSPRSMEFLVTQGYAVVAPDAPILGPSGRMNDNYIADLRNNLAAVIDELDEQGIIDRSRLGVGGHSYGAFSTVNAMVHTPFFKAGIAGDGNYNRTLTPNGFQTERRDLWAARDVYLGMSPFYYANQLQGALLMYHGWADQNVGTDPQNSTRLFHALQGLGKTTALYMYPYEDHGPATKETLLDLWSRWTAWLDVYVKQADAEKPTVISLSR